MGTQLLPRKGAQQPPLFGPCLCGQSPISATDELLFYNLTDSVFSVMPFQPQLTLTHRYRYALNMVDSKVQRNLRVCHTKAYSEEADYIQSWT